MGCMQPGQITTEPGRGQLWNTSVQIYLRGPEHSLSAQPHSLWKALCTPPVGLDKPYIDDQGPIYLLSNMGLISGHGGQIEG